MFVQTNSQYDLCASSISRGSGRKSALIRAVQACSTYLCGVSLTHCLPIASLFQSSFSSPYTIRVLPFSKSPLLQETTTSKLETQALKMATFDSHADVDPSSDTAFVSQS